jgi:hypothetical protein
MVCLPACLPHAGARESHEPHRFLAVQALAEMMEAGSPHMVAAAPACVGPLRLGLNTLEPSLAGTCMLLLQRWGCGLRAATDASARVMR